MGGAGLGMGLGGGCEGERPLQAPVGGEGWGSGSVRSGISLEEELSAFAGRVFEM